MQIKLVNKMTSFYVYFYSFVHLMRDTYMCNNFLINYLPDKQCNEPNNVTRIRESNNNQL